MLKEIDIKVIKFLLNGSVYSELAIIKHFGINYEELENIYNRLEENGYLIKYTEYMEEKKSCNSSCGSCNFKCPVEKEGEDYSDIRVITEKALRDFSF